MEIKTINDYYDSVQQKFPQVDIKDIQRILKFGWKSIYLHNSYGGDVSVRDSDLWCYMGYLKRNSLKYFDYYVKKLALKIRILYSRRKIPWDGYYYFARSENQYQDYLSQQNKKGRKRKKFTFEKLKLYKILDECKVVEHGNPYIFRTSYPIELSNTLYYDKVTLDNCELIITRDPLKFKDILVTNNEYDIL